MKKKIILDIIMSAIIVLLMKTIFTGMLFHELLGLFVFILFLLHKFLNFNWIKGVTQKIFTDKITKKTKVMFGIDVLLFVLVTFTVVSGILISQNIFKIFQTKNLLFWSTWHHFSAYSAFVLISIHIGMHWQSVINMTKKIFKLSDINNVRTIISRILAVVIIFLGVKILFKPEILENFTAPFVPKNSNNKNTTISAASSSDISNKKVVTISSTTQIVENVPSLDEYLGNLFCQGCGRHCPLNALSCNKGKTYQDAAIEDYNKLYSEVINKSSEETTTLNEETQVPSSSSVLDNNESQSDISSKEEDYNITEAKNVTPLDFIFLMGLFIGSTHYILTIPNKLK